MNVDLDGDKITILLSKQDFENYRLIRGNSLWSASLVCTTPGLSDTCWGLIMVPTGGC